MFGWESFNVKLDGKQELSNVFNFSEPRFPVIVSKTSSHSSWQNQEFGSFAVTALA